MPAPSRNCSRRRLTIGIRIWAKVRDTPDDTRRRHVIHRLILWNVDLTLVDVARVSRDAYAEAFRKVTGRPLVALPQLAGASDSEIFFESLALNEALPRSGQNEENDLLARY